MNLHKQTIDDISLSGKRVIIRADFNVPLDDSLQITDDTRIRSTLPTINRVVDDGGKAILCSHLGRPKGKFDPKFSLAPIAKRLGRLLGKDVIFAPDCIGPNIESLVAKMKPGDVMLLENLRFHAGEEKNDETFSKSLAALGDVYINDAFGAAHRAHASTVGITKYVPVAAAGFLLKKEIEYLEGAVENPVRPFVAILGGAKVSGKIGVIENLGKRVDKVIIGGGMAFTFLKAKGLEIGNSLVENDMLDFAKGIVWSRPAANPAPKPKSSRFRKFQRVGMPSTSVPPRSSCLVRRCKMPRPFSGTVRWACLKSTHLPAGPSRSPTRLPTPTRSRSSAAAKPPWRFIGPANRRIFPSSPRAAAQRSNCWKASRCQASWPCLSAKINDSGSVRTTLIVGNWKMNKTASEAARFVRELASALPMDSAVEIVLAPPFTALESVRTVLGSASQIALGAQNMHWEPHGAFTGEVSGPMLRDLGCTYVIVGHSERRTLFGEKDHDVHRKVRAGLANGLRPILCVGESLDQRQSGHTESVVTGQIDAGLAELSASEADVVTIAYEPVWAIGTGHAATTEQAVAVHRSIRARLAAGWGRETAERVRILYGGSVTPQNAESLLRESDIDGALVGGACLKIESFATIALAAKNRPAH
jgi:phosphoglycerate kinase/triosephosphate isomerase (TIM)